MRDFIKNKVKSLPNLNNEEKWRTYMFGMGFMEILLVAVVAIIALGPEKLPTAMVDLAKMLKKLKRGLDDAKSSLDEELKISDMKAEANKFKAQFEEAKASVSISKKDLGIENLSLSHDLNMDDLLDDDEIEQPKKEKKKTPKKIKKEKVSLNEIEEDKTTDINSDANKFKVNFDENDKKSESI